jgi:hypothetical protein
MRSIARRLAVVLLVLIVASGSTGCTFYLLPGGGPAPRSAYADHLTGGSPAQAAELKSDALASHGFLGMGPMTIPGSGDLAGWALHCSRTFEWPILVGPIRTWWHLDPGPAGRAVVGHARAWGLLAPVLLLGGSERSYDADTGLAVAREDMVIAACGLFVCHRATSPARQALVFRDLARRKVGPFAVPDVRGDLSAVPYDHASALALGWGAFAVGTRNHRAYLQLAWIPIPLWRVSE